MKPILTFFCFLLLVCPGFAKDKQPGDVKLAELLKIIDSQAMPDTYIGKNRQAWVDARMAKLTEAQKDLHGRHSMAGVMVTAYDEALEMSASVFTAPDGKFELKGLRKTTHQVRVRRPGKLDEWATESLGGGFAVTHPVCFGANR
ncbi:MAG: hypothetical protein CL923_11660 [Deltaproteobacteria bacterium]|jgi:hypothetical protein|nr:hypothetical protein [Deltaproteobacteria bacterium]MBT22383.1 hypothetical protein [Candidatus Poribacteria bacterium]|tara:strand:+ start:380 stop:814 length:435 start_codon:yes stop_codon:yes gene_type:complete